MISKVWIIQSPAIPVNCWIILLIDFSVFSHAAHCDFSTEIALEHCIGKQVEAKVCSSKDNVSHKELFELESTLLNLFSVLK